jgi:hypothetical protein
MPIENWLRALQVRDRAGDADEVTARARAHEIFLLRRDE